jgi:amino acid transporter
MVVIKLSVLMLFVVVGITGWNTDNLADFAPFGVSGIWVATGGIFFSFIGLDAVSTAGEEVKDPQRTMPRAIVLGLMIVSTVYVLVAVVAVAAQPWKKFEGQEAGLAQILQDVTGSTWPGTVIAAGAIISIFSVTLITLYGQTRILFAMSRDGMVPKLFQKIHPRTLTPVNGTVVVAIVVSLLAGLVPLSKLADLVSIGTLTAFSVVSAAVIILRRTAPDLPRGFRVPFYPWVPITSIVFSMFVVIGLPTITFVVFGVWVAAWLAFYLMYGVKHSRLGQRPEEDAELPQLDDQR